jgi:hypothetical protein
MWRSFVFAGLFVIFGLARCGGAEDRKELDLDTRDFLLLLQASFCKVRVNGAPGQIFRLELADKAGRSRREMKMKLPEEGTGILTVMTYDKSGVTGTSTTIELYVRWQTGPRGLVAPLRWQKFWNPHAGTIVTGNGDETFSSLQGTWNIAEEKTFSLCTVKRHPDRHASEEKASLEGKEIASLRLVKVEKGEGEVSGPPSP